MTARAAIVAAFLGEAERRIRGGNAHDRRVNAEALADAAIRAWGPREQTFEEAARSGGRASVRVLDLGMRDFVSVAEGAPGVKVVVDGLAFTVAKSPPGPGRWSVTVNPENGEAIELRVDEIQAGHLQVRVAVSAMTEFDEREGVG